MSDRRPLRIVLTGVTRGLGRALLARFVEAGHRVAGCGRSRAGVEALRERFSRQRFDVLDVAEPAAVEAA